MNRKSFLRNIPLEEIERFKWSLTNMDTIEVGVSICPDSGLILLSPSPHPDELLNYYKNDAVYINPGREGKPSDAKVQDLTRLMNTVGEVVGSMPESVFQVGCSDGYTLHRFRGAGANTIAGIDPSVASHELAKKLYGFETIVGNIEDYEPGSQKFELIILTHVLEHLFDPISCLNTCASMQAEGSWLLIEVPLFERRDLFPPGILTIEHVNYFSESTLIETLTRAGYSPHFVGKYFHNNEYPVITVVCKLSKKTEVIVSEDYVRAKEVLLAYIREDRQRWSAAEQKIKSMISPGTDIYIYGAGFHTSQLLAFTGLDTYANINGLLDSSPTKWGSHIGNIKCENLSQLHLQKGDTILISSYDSEEEIYQGLRIQRENGVTVLKVYGDGE